VAAARIPGEEALSLRGRGGRVRRLGGATGGRRLRWSACAAGLCRADSHRVLDAGPAFAVLAVVRSGESQGPHPRSGGAGQPEPLQALHVLSRQRGSGTGDAERWGGGTPCWGVDAPLFARSRRAGGTHSATVGAVGASPSGWAAGCFGGRTGSRCQPNRAGVFEPSGAGRSDRPRSGAGPGCARVQGDGRTVAGGTDPGSLYLDAGRGRRRGEGRRLRVAGLGRRDRDPRGERTPTARVD